MTDLPWHSSGTLLRREALLAGIDDNALARLVRNGTLVRIRSGAYAEAARWESADPAAQHLMRCAAVLRTYPRQVALAGVSACLWHDAPDWALDLEHVHLAHLEAGTSARIGAGVRHHKLSYRVGDLTRRDGYWISSPGRAGLEAALTLPYEPAVVLLSDIAHRGLTTIEELTSTAACMQTWPGSLAFHRLLPHVDVQSESVGERRSMALFRRLGLPLPEQQWEVFRPDGRLAGRCDFVWHRWRLICEFDGMVKYGRYLKPGETVVDAVIREKRREDLLRELTGYRMIRLVWADLERPEHTDSRLRTYISSAA